MQTSACLLDGTTSHYKATKKPQMGRKWATRGPLQNKKKIFCLWTTEHLTAVSFFRKKPSSIWNLISNWHSTVATWTLTKEIMFNIKRKFISQSFCHSMCDTSKLLYKEQNQNQSKALFCHFLKQNWCKIEFPRIFKDWAWLEHYTNSDEKGTKRIVF